MKTLTILLILCIFLPGCEKAEAQQGSQQKIQEAKQTINNKLREMYVRQTNQPDTLYKVDPNVTAVAEILSSDTFRTQKPEVDKNEIRKLLQKQGNFDYQVHYVKMPLNNLQTASIVDQLNMRSNLSRILNNPYANRQGIARESENGQYIVHLLFTEHYIEFKQDEFKFSLMVDNQTSYKRIMSGKTFKDSIYYNTINQKSVQDTIHLRDAKKKLQLDANNHFSLEFKKDLNIYLMDQNGNILSNRNLLGW
jgi:hypothetical protein